MNESTKVCKRCHISQPFFRFAINKGKPNGLNQWCRACVAQFSLKPGKKCFDHTTLEGTGRGYCARCKETGPVSEFNRNKRTPTGISRYCRPCEKLYAELRESRKLRT